MQTAGNLVATAAELTACVQNGENNRQSRYTHFLVRCNRYTAAVITD